MKTIKVKEVKNAIFNHLIKKSNKVEGSYLNAQG